MPKITKVNFVYFFVLECHDLAHHSITQELFTLRDNISEQYIVTIKNMAF